MVLSKLSKPWFSPAPGGGSKSMARFSSLRLNGLVGVVDENVLGRACWGGFVWWFCGWGPGGMRLLFAAEVKSTMIDNHASDASGNGRVAPFLISNSQATVELHGRAPMVLRTARLLARCVASITCCIFVSITRCHRLAGCPLRPPGQFQATSPIRRAL